MNVLMCATRIEETYFNELYEIGNEMLWGSENTMEKTFCRSFNQ